MIFWDRHLKRKLSFDPAINRQPPLSTDDAVPSLKAPQCGALWLMLKVNTLGRH